MPHHGRRPADQLLLQRHGPLVPLDRVGRSAAAAQERGQVVVAQRQIVLITLALRMLAAESRSRISTASRDARSAAAGSRLREHVAEIVRGNRQVAGVARLGVVRRDQAAATARPLRPAQLSAAAASPCASSNMPRFDWLSASCAANAGSSGCSATKLPLDVDRLLIACAGFVGIVARAAARIARLLCVSASCASNLRVAGVAPRAALPAAIWALAVFRDRLGRVARAWPRSRPT